MTGLVGLTWTPFGSFMDWSDVGPSFPCQLFNIMPYTGTMIRDRQWWVHSLPEANLNNSYRAFSKKNMAFDWLLIYNAQSDKEAKEEWLTKNGVEQELLRKVWFFSIELQKIIKAFPSVDRNALDGSKDTKNGWQRTG